MALKITDNLKNQILSTNYTPVIIAQIEGYDKLLGNIAIQEYIRIGDPGLTIGSGWHIGDLKTLDDQLSLISLNSGTTTRITQKLDMSRGNGSSISNMILALLDYNEAMTALVSPGIVLNDVIGRRVTIYSGAKDTSWPQDYNVIFRGTITNIKSSATTIYLALSNTDEKKRVSLFPKVSSELLNPIDFKSVLFQDIQYKNREDVTNLITINYTPGGTAGNEVVTIGGGGYTINVQIADNVSTAAQIKKAVENHSGANQLVEVKILGNSSDTQTIGSTTLGTDTVIDILSAEEFIEPADSLRTYAVIDDELIEYTGISGNQLTGVTREQEGSFAEYHQAEQTINQVLRLTGNTIDVALKLMLSQGPAFYLENVSVYSFQSLSVLEYEDNAIYFKGVDLEKDHGVSVGDLVTITGDPFGANNVVDSIIVEIGIIDDGSYIIVADDLVDSVTTSAVAKFKSQFNVLPIGLGMIPSEVDVSEHLRIRDTFLPIAPQDIFFREISDAKQFLESQIYLPYTCYSVPRKGRSSIVYTVAPMPTYDIVPLNLLTVQNPEALVVERSSTENFINQLQFDYDYDPVSEKFLTHKNYPTEIDTTRIPIGAKPLNITAQGLRTADGASDFTERASDRFLRRYKFGADFIKGIKVMYSVGYQIEIGDVVAVDFTALKLSDFITGSRLGDIRLMEVTNTIRDEKTGEITIDVLNTTFGTQDRYGLISPSSLTDVGSTTTKLRIKKSFTTKSFQKESYKWNGYINQNIIVHNEDWSLVYSTTIRGFDNESPQGMAIDAIPSAPGENWIIQCPEYPSSVDPNEELFWKQRHAFCSPRVSVVAGVSTTQFTVSALDVGRFFIGSIIRVHNYTFTIDSPEVKVVNIIGNDIYVNSSLGFTPSSSEFVDLIGFPDKQQSYRVV